MTGRAQGYCMLKVPQTPQEPATGYAGMQGVSVTTASFSLKHKEISRLKAQAVCMENALRLISRRIDYLEGLCTGGGEGS
ncbi:hypothetical protein SCFA_1450003 [anaerobic digester metagenome]|jgi:hypothetical protein|uniref:Uncharacterized protein n=1 Tax=anaerobic digester metagenome TaxID=1263854 RepID=A0A485LYU3_9ZZZZ